MKTHLLNLAAERALQLVEVAALFTISKNGTPVEMQIEASRIEDVPKGIMVDALVIPVIVRYVSLKNAPVFDQMAPGFPEITGVVLVTEPSEWRAVNPVLDFDFDQLAAMKRAWDQRPVAQPA